MAPAARAASVSQAAARSARFWVLDLLCWACSTSVITCERKESSPNLLTSMVSEPSPFTDPPITSSPAPLDTGFDSPVSRDSLTLLVPSTTSPSAGTFSPGFTTSRSPTSSASSGTSSIEPSSLRRCASAGISSASFSSAREALITDRISIQWPTSIMSTSVASSQKNTFPSRPNTTAEL